MSDPQPNQSQQPPKDEKELNVKVKIDDEAYKRLIEEQKRIEEAKKKLEEELTTIKADKTKSDEAKKAAEDKLLEVQGKAEELEEKLSLIAQKEFEKKRAVVLEKAKTLLGTDESRLKEVESKTATPEDLKATEYMLEVLEKTVKQGEESYKKLLADEKKKMEEELAKKAGTPAGVAPLNTPQVTGQSTPTGKTGYDSYEAMIKDLRIREKSSDPQVAAEAKTILDEFFRKWATAVKKQYQGRLPTGISYELSEERKEGGALKEEQPSIREITRPKKAIQAEKQGE